MAPWCCRIAFLICLNFALPILRLYAYPYLRLYVRGTMHCLLAYCLVNPKNWSLWWKLRGTAVKKPQVWSPLGLYRHVIISFMTFWPCRTSSDCSIVRGIASTYCSGPRQSGRLLFSPSSTQTWTRITSLLRFLINDDYCFIDVA